MRQRSAQLLALCAGAALLAACGATVPAADPAGAPAAARATVAGPAVLRPGPWLDAGRTCPETGRRLDDPAWPLVADARADSARTWLWGRLDLPGGVVRVAGTGALVVTVLVDGRERRYLDQGIHVPLEGGEAGYLNSEGGPFTIRPRHVAAADAAPGCLLIALPPLDTRAVTAVALTPVPGRWTALP